MSDSEELNAGDLHEYNIQQALKKGVCSLNDPDD